MDQPGLELNFVVQAVLDLRDVTVSASWLLRLGACSVYLLLGFYVLQELLLGWGIPESIKREDYLCAYSPAFLRRRQEDHLNTGV